jgi:hypothetical protein
MLDEAPRAVARCTCCRGADIIAAGTAECSGAIGRERAYRRGWRGGYRGRDRLGLPADAIVGGAIIGATQPMAIQSDEIE